MFFTKTDSVKPEGVSHDPNILKKVFLKRGQVPNLMQFGSAIFEPGQSVAPHKHPTMTEVFLITEGKIDFEVEGERITAKEGDCITIEAGEVHSQNNRYTTPVKWIYFGVGC